ncbi:hypothetical protein [Leucobacter ruminantium]|uniref:Uncharacterized protein n=1 Tax=Leucobacter ruminantium TaxID=1289170 RepID=A0A939M0N1_9MICO|nr:hypothetical protein [Leucobacter ruminantium]MBO1805862.1 hypothetical protein [Leucobacter ruminantium]
MAIQENITIELASVEVDDEYRIELRQEKKRMRYTVSQARDLATELMYAAERVDTLIAEDMAERGLRLTHGVIVTDDGEVVL